MGYDTKEISRFSPDAQRQILLKLLEQNRGKCAKAVAQEAMREGIRFAIPLNPVTKKNSQRIIRCGKYSKIAPSEAYEKYERDAAPFLPCRGERFNSPCEVVGLFYMKKRIRVDLANLIEALDDLLVAGGVLEDDNSRIVVSHDGSRVLYDPFRPRTEVVIRFLESDEISLFDA
ncbi:MAG: hypothetical protein IJT94_15480 [Oscillibacter sp.]|nr:hypothetical protein [Oscillibacter sp.]